MDEFDDPKCSHDADQSSPDCLQLNQTESTVTLTPQANLPEPSKKNTNISQKTCSNYPTDDPPNPTCSKPSPPFPKILENLKSNSLSSTVTIFSPHEEMSSANTILAKNSESSNTNIPTSDLVLCPRTTILRTVFLSLSKDVASASKKVVSNRPVCSFLPTNAMLETVLLSLLENTKQTNLKLPTNCSENRTLAILPSLRPNCELLNENILNAIGALLTNKPSTTTETAVISPLEGTEQPKTKVLDPNPESTGLNNISKAAKPEDSTIKLHTNSLASTLSPNSPRIRTPDPFRLLSKNIESTHKNVQMGNPPLRIRTSDQILNTNRPRIPSLPSPMSLSSPHQPQALFLLALSKLNESSLNFSLINYLQSSFRSVNWKPGDMTPPDSLTSAPPSYSFVLRQSAARRRPRLMGTFIPSPSFVQHTPPPTYATAFDIYIDSGPPPPPRIYTFGFAPMPVMCPECGYTGMTFTTCKITLCTHISACILCLFCCWICAPLPYVLRSCKNVYHYCRNCRYYMGMYCPTNPETPFPAR